MATVIDAFLVTLGLDGTQFQRGMSDAEKERKRLADASTRGNRDRETQERTLANNQQRRQRLHDQGTRSTIEGYRKIRNELLMLTAVFTAGVGIKDFISDTINGAVNLGYLSENLSETTTKLTAFQRASERAGGTAAGAIAQLKESQDTLAQFRSGMGPNEGLQAFFRWGGDASQLNDGNSYLMDRARIVHEMFKVDPAKAAMVAKQMAISEDQFEFVKRGPAAMEALTKAQEKHAAITMADSKAAEKLKVKMLDLRDSLQATATRIVLQLAPTLTLLFAKLEKGAQWVEAHKDDIGKWISSAIVAVEKFLVSADKFATAVGGWGNVLAGIAAAPIVMALGSIAMAIAGIVAAGAGIPVLAAAIASLAAMSGYKIAKDLDKAFGSGEGRDRRMHADIMAGGTGMGVATSKEAMKREAARQRAGGGSRQSFSGTIKGLPGSDTGIMGKLMAQGWTREQAAGIAGSFMQESGLDPNAKNPTSSARGIGQWLTTRAKDFKAFTGKDLQGSTLDEQLAFFQHETSAGGKEARAGNLLRGATTAEDAARIHSEAYERPGADEANVARRQRLARQFAAGGRMDNAMAAGAMPSGAGASVNMGGNRTSTSTHDVRIEQVTVNTQATDAKGIAAALPGAIKYEFASQANTGMN